MAATKTDLVVEGLGWKPELPDVRDYSYRHKFMPQRFAAEELPPVVDLRPNMSPVRNQGNIGSCVGFSVCAAVEYLRRTDEDIYSTIYSPLFMYYQARIEEGPEWRTVDAGAYIRLGIKALTKAGASPESNWPYDETKFARTPNKTAYKAAERWKLGSYYRCEGTDAILHALASGKCVVGGFTCYASMFTPEVDRTGRIPVPGRTSGDYVVGGHAICYCGYDRPRGEALFKNSWGSGWGDEGYGRMPLQMVGNPTYSDDFWCLAQEA